MTWSPSLGRIVCGCTNGWVLRGDAGESWPEPCGFCKGKGEVSVHRLVAATRTSYPVVTAAVAGHEVRRDAAARLAQGLGAVADTFGWNGAPPSKRDIHMVELGPLFATLASRDGACSRCGGEVSPFVPPLPEDFHRYGFARLLCVACAGFDVAASHEAACRDVRGGKGFVDNCSCAHCAAKGCVRA